MLCVYKPLGLTPLQLIQKLKETQPDLVQKKISYAGRLDPMAEGLMLLLIDEENKNRHAIEAVHKTYEFQVLLGVSTDTYDTLGMITHFSMKKLTADPKKIDQVLQTFKGTSMQSYPPYSSRTVAGKPLYWYARNKKLTDLIIPSHEVTISSITLHEISTLPIPSIQQTIRERLDLVSGDFRQSEILTSWETFFEETKLDELPLLTCSVTCSSGTYVRSLCHEMGSQLTTPSLAYSIKRTRIGSYTLGDALTLPA